VGSHTPQIERDRQTAPQLLLDTHIVVRWLTEPKRLSREQWRALDKAVSRGEPLAVSAMTLLEIALLSREGGKRLPVPVPEIFAALGSRAGFQIVPIDIAVASEFASLGDMLRDPGDRTIVATARVHRFRLVTSDERILESKLVSVVE
jgi:PIN domain nuclease of toxin-antitoxin system